MKTGCLIFMLIMLLSAGLAYGQGASDLSQPGKEIFEDNCAACHRSSGQGLPDKFPALDKDSDVTGDPAPVIATVLNGKKGKLGQMPSWKDKFNDREVAAVLTYIRGAWSNHAPAVTPAAVAAIRGK